MPPEARLNPFPGLRPFEAEEDYLFFGREKQVDELLRRLRTTRFLSVIGTSGSGKSSLIRAGLIPALEGGFMAQAGSSWRVAKFRPGANPVGNLAEVLSDPAVLGTDPDLASTHRVLIEATLRRGTRGLADAVRQAKIPAEDNLLVVVDQFEELFRFRRSRLQENSRDEAQSFVKLLLEATQQETPIYVVLTMRSDFIGDCMEYAGLPEAVNAGLYLVPRMTRDQLRSAISGPVAVAGAQIAPRLVLRLLNDVGDNQDQLPVLQHALMRTWEHWQGDGRTDEAIDIADYEAVGTMRHALSKHAEEAYEEAVSQDRKAIAERLFKALTDTFSDPRGVRHPTSVEELVNVCSAPEPELVQVIELFRRTGRSFLMPPPSVALAPETVVDISHESLMRCWSRLMGWAEEESRSALMYTRIAQAAKWFQEGTAGLWRDPELELGLQWRQQARPTVAWARRYGNGFETAMQFLDRSAEQREHIRRVRDKARRRKLRQFQWAAAVFAILLIVATSSFFVARAQRARAEYYLQQAQNAVNEMLSSAGRQQARVAADVPEMDAFRKDLLEKAKVFYASFEQREPENDEIRTEMARAHFRLGDINRLLENRSAAAEQYQHAITDFGHLAERYPRRAELREWLANSYNWLGETLRVQPAMRGQAEQAYDHALALQQALVRENPNLAVYQREQARTYYNRGIVRYDRGHLDDSAADFRRAIELLKALAGSSADPGVSQELARAYNDLGVLLRHQDRSAEAEPLLQQAAALDQQLTERYPENRDYKFELATYYNNLALLSVDEKQYEVAQQRNGRALILLEELSRPAASLSIQLAQGYNLAAQVSESKGAAAVKTECQRSHDILDKLSRNPNARGRPELRQLYRDLGYNYLELAQLELRSSSLEDAQQALDKCSRLLPELSEADARELKQSYQKLQQEVQNRRATRK